MPHHHRPRMCSINLKTPARRQRVLNGSLSKKMNRGKCVSKPKMPPNQKALSGSFQQNDDWTRCQIEAQVDHLIYSRIMQPSAILQAPHYVDYLE